MNDYTKGYWGIHAPGAANVWGNIARETEERKRREASTVRQHPIANTCYQQQPSQDNGSRGIRISFLVTQDDARQQFVIRPSFTIDGYQGVTCSIVAYFYNHNRIPLKASHSEYATVDRTVCARRDFRPPLLATSISPNSPEGYILDFAIPYNALNLAKGKHLIHYHIDLYAANWNMIGRSDWYSFPMNWG